MNQKIIIADLVLAYLGRDAVTLKGDSPGHPFRGNQYGEGQGGGGESGGDDSSGSSGGGESSGGSDHSSQIKSDLEKSLSSYGERGVTVQHGFHTSEQYKFSVHTPSAIITKRLEGKLQRRSARGGLSQIHHVSPTMFTINLPRAETDAAYAKNKT